MPIIKSAKKRARQTAVRSAQNLATKRTMRSEIKALDVAISEGKAAKVQEQFKKAQSAIDTAVKKNVIHKNKAARKKAQLSAKVKTVSGTKPAAAKKPAAKKPAAAAKKPAAKTAAKK